MLLPAIIFASLVCISNVRSSLFSQTLRPSLQLHGSPENHFYPLEDVPGPKPLPAWVTAYRKAKSHGLIPSIKPSVLSNGNPKYHHYSDSALSDLNKVCSWTISKCNSREDINTAPYGKMGISFDDGPQAPTSKLLSFLRHHNQTATHFLIGSRILDQPKLLLETYKKNHDHLAVHTWSHPYMTTLTDEQVLGEIGWTMQIIHDLTGVVPAFWRPPYGDIDNRVRAISRYVFGLTTVMWSVDPNDWCLSDNASPGSECKKGSGPQNMHQLTHELKKQVTQGVSAPNRFPKDGIISLEHELSQRTVRGFMNIYPLAKSIGWDTKAIPDLFGLGWYHKALSNSSQAGILPELDDLNATSNPISTPILSPRNETGYPIPTSPSNTSNTSTTPEPAPQGNSTEFLIVPRTNVKNSSFIPIKNQGVASTLEPSLNISLLAYLNTIMFTYAVLKLANLGLELFPL